MGKSKKQTQSLLVILFVTAGLLKCMTAMFNTSAKKTVQPGEGVSVASQPVECF